MSGLMMWALMFVAGLVVGWSFLPQPSWVKKLMDKLMGKKAPKKRTTKKKK